MDETNKLDPVVEQYRNNVDAWRARLKKDLDWELESFKATMQYAAIGIRGLVLVNGGAAVAILAFLGNLASKDTVRAAELGAAVMPSMTAFLTGVSLGVLSAGAAYIAQAYFTLRKDSKGLPFQIAAVAFAAFGILAFVVGAMMAAYSFSDAFR